MPLQTRTGGRMTSESPTCVARNARNAMQAMATTSGGQHVGTQMAHTWRLLGDSEHLWSQPNYGISQGLENLCCLRPTSMVAHHALSPWVPVCRGQDALWSSMWFGATMDGVHVRCYIYTVWADMCLTTNCVAIWMQSRYAEDVQPTVP